jgi:hypothetical protein
VLCIWKLPPWSKGELLRGTVGASFQGATAQKAFAKRVR